MTYNDLRKGRVSMIGQVYLVTTPTFRRARLFDDLFLARKVVTALRVRDREGDTRTLAFVVMPDHVHWLFELTASTLGEVMRKFKGGAAREINLSRGRVGSVWQPGFHDHALRNEECLVSAARYVVLNPIRAGLVEKLGEYSHWDTAWGHSMLGVPL